MSSETWRLIEQAAHDERVVEDAMMRAFRAALFDEIDEAMRSPRMKIETRFNVGDKVCLLDSAKEGRVLAQEILAVSYGSKSGTWYHVPGGACFDEPSVVPAPKFEVGQWVNGVYGIGTPRKVEAMKWVDRSGGGSWAYTLAGGAAFYWDEAEIVAVDPPKPEPRFAVGDLVSPDPAKGYAPNDVRKVTGAEWLCGQWRYTLDDQVSSWPELLLIPATQPKPEPAPAVEFKFKVGQIAYMPPHNECTVAASFIVNGLPAYLVASEATKVEWLYEVNLKPA